MNNNESLSQFSKKRFAIGILYSKYYQDRVRPIVDVLAQRFSKDRILFDEYHKNDFNQTDPNSVASLYGVHSEMTVYFLGPNHEENELGRDWRSYFSIPKEIRDPGWCLLLSFGDDGLLDKVSKYGGKCYNILTKTNKEVADLIFEHYELYYPLIANRVNLIHPGSTVPPCFRVEEQAGAFISMLDSFSSPQPSSLLSQPSNISMIGIFAPWGRGKTYFFNQVKSRLINRPKDTIQYDIIEFNAWKYQTVPAIWASLFETVYQHKNKWFRLWFSITQKAWSFFRDMFVFITIPVFVWLLSSLPILSEWANKTHITLWSSILAIIAFVLKYMAQHQDAIESIIGTFTKRITFTEHLGIQAEIERELGEYLKMWIKEKDINSHKVLLYVEDVDRCDSDKMISIIESLRTVLEQPEIRKRLIVIISIDPKKLWRALEIKYKGIYNDKELYSTVIDHFDKLFIASITLPPLEYSDEKQYLDALNSSHNQGQQEESVSTTHKSEAKENDLKHNDESNPFKKRVRSSSFINNQDTIQLLSYSLSLFDKAHFTPRQLNCLYYRSLLAITLLSYKSLDKSRAVSPYLTNQIILRSYLHGQDEYSTSHSQLSTYESILNMVIPYPDIEPTAKRIEQAEDSITATSIPRRQKKTTTAGNQ